MQSYKIDIEYDALRPPNGMPIGLVFVFIDGVPIQKFSICRPAQANSDNKTFSVGILAPEDCPPIDAYLYGKKYRFFPVDSLEGINILGHESHHIDFAFLNPSVEVDEFHCGLCDSFRRPV